MTRSPSNPLLRARSRIVRAYRILQQLESLEPRLLMTATTEVLSYHYDMSSSGQNLTETILTPSNVNTATFGKIATIVLDGQVYAQPLLKANVNITRGSFQGIHNVLYVATQHGSLYALDAQTGITLWKDTFLNITDPTQASGTAGVTPIPTADVVNSADVAPEIGILATPIIEGNTLYLDMSSKETRGTDKHYVQRLWAVNIQNGAALRSTVIGDTIKNTAISGSTQYNGYQYVTGPWVDGTGNNAPIHDSANHMNMTADGWITSTDTTSTAFTGTTPTAQGKIAFNALLQMNRPALTIVGSTIYLAYASHGDDGPYYGWLLGYNTANFAQTAAFVTCPTFKNIVGNRADYRAQSGIWMSGDRIASDGTYLYVTIGNGIWDTSPSNFDANGFPIDHDYGNAILKIALDPLSSQNSQNGNGFGLKVVDYFVPANAVKLNQIDADIGSGGVLLIDSSAIPGHPHLLVAGGKEGRIYLIDRDNMGKFAQGYNNTSSEPVTFDNVLGEASSGGPNTQGHQFYSTGSYFNGRFIVALAKDPIWAFNLATFPTGTIPPGSNSNTKDAIFNTNNTASGQVGNTGSRGSTLAITANGTSNAIIWSLVNNYSGTGAPADNLLAFSAAVTGGASASPIYDSNSNLARDQLTIVNGTNSASVGVKFTVPTVANGLVYTELGTKNNGTSTFQGGGIVIYGLLNPTLHTLTGLTASATSSTSIHLGWTRNAADTESETVIERSLNGTTWSVLTILGPKSNSYDDTGLTPGVNYFYRVTEVYGAGSSATSAPANTTTPATPLALQSVISRKLQGAGNLDLNLPMTGTPSVEYRNNGPTTIIFNFDAAPTMGPSFLATASSGNVTGTSIIGNSIAVNLSGVTNNSVLTVSLTDVGGSNFSITLGVLLGDLTQNGLVDITDLTMVANHWQTNGVDGDINGDNFIDIGDLTAVANNWQFQISGGGFGSAGGFDGTSSGTATPGVTSASSSGPATGNHNQVIPPTSSQNLITSDSSEEDSLQKRGNRLLRSVRKTVVNLVKIPRPGN